ncbi:MAG: hypothetical protein JWO30_4774 [Fibrobacteres bacterium]|nr:hypothetical protein [Fibrobacterota bacterium]
MKASIIRSPAAWVILCMAALCVNSVAGATLSVLDTSAVHKLFLDGDFEKATGMLEAGLRKAAKPDPPFRGPRFNLRFRRNT